MPLRGDAGCSSTAVTTQAEIMNSASSADSIKYSGQRVLSASAADRCVCFAGINPPATGEETIAASVEFVMRVSVMRDGYRHRQEVTEMRKGTWRRVPQRNRKYLRPNPAN